MNLPIITFNPKNSVIGNIETTVQPVNLPLSQASNPSGVVGHGRPLENSSQTKIPRINAIADIMKLKIKVMETI